jgi:hypothetical protein
VIGEVVLAGKIPCLTDAPPSPPVFFVTADSKDVTGGTPVSADSAGVKAAVFSASWEWLVSADSKGVIGASCL